MKANIITKDMSLLLGSRLGGIDGKVIENNEDVLKAFNSYINDKDVALLIVSKDCYNLIRKEVDTFKQNRDKPLIVVLD